MPIEIKQYQCDICGATYATEGLARDCEMSHVHVKSIDAEIYNMYSTVPDRLDVKMSTGVIVHYSLGSGTRL